MHQKSELLEFMTMAALEAGKAILEIYNSPIKAEQKSDGTPVTVADQKAEEIIIDMLQPTGIPILAEESAASGHIPELGKRFFVVDPLDGTKEFIKKNHEFTVNIALIESGKPVCGIVTAPALKQGFVGCRQGGAYRFALDGAKAKTKISIDKCSDWPPKFVTSRSHKSSLPKEVSGFFADCQESSIGSSLKFCLLAAGDAQIYPRFSRTSEWDTAAGQAVLEAAGGVVLTLGGSPLSYGKVENNFINPNFIAANCKELAEKILQKLKRK